MHLRQIANLKADFRKHIMYLATHNRTINTEGRAQRRKPTDQNFMVEHYNQFVMSNYNFIINSTYLFS